MSMKKGFLLLAVLFLASIALPFRASFAAQDKNADDNAPIDVKVTHVVQKTLPNIEEALGTLKALQSTTISSEVDGRITKILYKDGAKVKKGDLIVQLNNTQDKATLASDLASLNLKRTTYERYQKLSSLGAIAQQQLDTLRADMEDSQAAVKSAEATLKQKEIRAPFTGVLGAFQVHVGDYISAGKAIVKLVNRQELEADYTLPEQTLPKLKKGQKVSVTVSAYPKRKFPGAVSFIAPSVNKTTGSVAIQARIENPDDLLSPGMFVNINQIIGVQKDALMIPEEAVQANLQGYWIFKVVNGKAIKVKVVPGSHDNGMVAINKGLKLSDQVVALGQQKLSDGSAVNVIGTVAPSAIKKTGKSQEKNH